MISNGRNTALPCGQEHNYRFSVSGFRNVQSLLP
jgi:hypothetical protein